MNEKPGSNALDAQVSALLDIALDAVNRARMLMSRQISDEKPVPPTHVSTPELKQELKKGLLASLVEQRSLPRIARTGKKGAKILLRLLDEPDIYITHDVLAEAADLRSQTSDAIKVYICYLRDALQERGYDPDMIETGLRSYRIRAKDTESLIEFLMSV